MTGLAYTLEIPHKPDCHLRNFEIERLSGYFHKKNPEYLFENDLFFLKLQ